MTHTSGCSTAQGVVEQVKENEGRTAIKVDDRWYSTFSTCNVKNGDKVELRYVVREKGNKVYRNLKSVEVLNQPTPTTGSTHTTTKDACINRAVALKCATQWAGSVDVVRVLVVADAFYGWLQGDPVQPGDYEQEQALDGDGAPF